MTKKAIVLFLCTGNSCRSQMAEGWAHKLLGLEVDAYSAGIETHGLNPRAVQIMSEVDIDISTQESQNIDMYLGLQPDLVVTVCDHAAEVCPTFPAQTHMLHQSFPDPAQATGTEEEILEKFRSVRDDIKQFITTLPDIIRNNSKHS